jgi:hypothetical protein
MGAYIMLRHNLTLMLPYAARQWIELVPCAPHFYLVTIVAQNHIG